MLLLLLLAAQAELRDLLVEGTVLGDEYYTILCLVIITSALSTLDSTFSAVVPDTDAYP